MKGSLHFLQSPDRWGFPVVRVLEGSDVVGLWGKDGCLGWGDFRLMGPITGDLSCRRDVFRGGGGRPNGGDSGRGGRGNLVGFCSGVLVSFLAGGSGDGGFVLMDCGELIGSIRFGAG